VNIFETGFFLLIIAVVSLSGCGGGSSDGGGSATFAVGGNVSGLLGAGLVLQNNATDDLALSADGSFTFSTAIEDLAAYSVTVLNQPSSPSQTCSINNASGAVAGVEVSDISINCLPSQVSLSVSANQAKTLTFSWDDVGADHYKLLKNPDGNSGYSQVGDDLNSTSVDETIAVHLQDWLNASYITQACSALGDCTDSAAVSATDAMLDAIGYIKAPNTNTKDRFGYSLAMSEDGNTLAVGAYLEDSNATGIDGDADNSEASSSGAAYVYSRSAAGWSQQAYIKASNTGASDYFGISVALSEDGNSLAVGAMFEASNATGIDGDASNNEAANSGAVYVYSRIGANWSQQAYVKASNTEADDAFGFDVALSGDGNTLAVGALLDSSNATGIDGDDSNNEAANSGAVYVFSLSGATWSQQAYIKAANSGEGDFFGINVALSGDGNTLAVGAYTEDSNAKTIDGDSSNNWASDSGAVYVFNRNGATWSQQAYIKASNTDAADRFGISIALSKDGNTLAVGAIYESSNATGIDGDADNNVEFGSGAVYVFSLSGTSWIQQAYIKASNTGAANHFGVSVALSQDGDTLAVGANLEDSNATGINGDASDNAASDSGAVYVFSRSGGNWHQKSYIKAFNTDTDDYFGFSVALSENGNSLAVGAYWEDSNATGIGGDSSNNEAENSGAVYLY